ncbi:MAG: glycosyltransferase [Ignavibacteriaceae bacterium]|nr:glycosyltransferase [Ignavibacteriaceae bacterium]
MIKVITPTGNRPEALKLLNSYLERQTLQDFEWIVLDDCLPATEIPERCDKFIEPSWIWSGENTQHRSMLRLLEECEPEDKVIICEDDDWYSPDYLQKTSDLLDKHIVVGQKKSIYYNIANQTYRKFDHRNHACLCQTAFTGKKALERMKAICKQENKPIDVTFWKMGGKLTNDIDVIGIKGMKGRDGIGIGHKMEGIKDDWTYLRELIGDDVKNYHKRFFICASGGSLTQKDVDYIRGKGTVIVINNTRELAPWADILYACDARWWEAYPEALNHKGRKISILYDHPKVEKYPMNNNLNGIGETRIRTGGNSGHQAINLAYLLGATEIILLGYDMQVTNGLSHWHGDHKRGLSQKECFKGWIGHLGVVATQAKEKGLKIINCTRQTALTCFESKNLEDVC